MTTHDTAHTDTRLIPDLEVLLTHRCSTAPALHEGLNMLLGKILGSLDAVTVGGYDRRAAGAALVAFGAVCGEIGRTTSKTVVSMAAIERIAFEAAKIIQEADAAGVGVAVETPAPAAGESVPWDVPGVPGVRDNPQPIDTSAKRV